jgi:hypothetical protein
VSGISHVLHLATEIQRKHPPREWAAAIERLPEHAREECRVYLRGMYHRARVVAVIKGNKLCPTDPQPLPAPPAGT